MESRGPVPAATARGLKTSQHLPRGQSEVLTQFCPSCGAAQGTIEIEEIEKNNISDSERNPMPTATFETKKLSSYIEKFRITYPNAYKPWTKEDDEKLEELYLAGRTSKELCLYFGRNIGAIISRIDKLELLKN